MVLIASREDTSSSGALASCRQCWPGEQGSAWASDQHKRWAEGGNRTGRLEVGVEHHNHKTRRTADCGVLGDTLPVAQRPDITPVIHRYLREARGNQKSIARRTNLRGTYSDNRHSINLAAEKHCTGNAPEAVAHGCVGRRLGFRSSDECSECYSHLLQPCRAFQVPAHCRRRNWCGLNHKLAVHQLPGKYHAQNWGTYQNCPLALLESWPKTWWRLCPDWCLAIAGNVDQVCCIGHPGNRNGTWSAWRIWLRRVVVGERKTEGTHHSSWTKRRPLPTGMQGHRMGLLWERGQKRLLYKGRPIKGKLQMPRTLVASHVVPFRGFQD